MDITGQHWRQREIYLVNKGSGAFSLDRRAVTAWVVWAGGLVSAADLETVKMPPTMAATEVTNCRKEVFLSEYSTMMG